MTWEEYELKEQGCLAFRIKAERGHDRPLKYDTASSYSICNHIKDDTYIKNQDLFLMENVFKL